MTLTSHRFVPALLFVGCLGLPACSSGADDQAVPIGKASLTRIKECAQTVCDRDRDDCNDDVDRCNDSCIRGSIESLSSCYAVCDGIRCPSCVGDDSPCATWSYRFSITGGTDHAIQNACTLAVARDQRCVETTVDPNCSRAGKLERREAERVYACIAATPCGADSGVCWDALPVGNLGQLFCRRLVELCEDVVCETDFKNLLDAASRWYEPDVVDAALECRAEDCSGARACLEAWIDAIAGEP